MESLKDKFFIIDTQELTLEDFGADGYVLDIGGGGEGIIGRLLGDRVIAIDVSVDELLEAPDGPLKIKMDARDLKFLDGSFDVVTAFFSLMYLMHKEDLLRIFREVHRVLRPGGRFYVWDVEVPKRPETDKDVCLVLLKVFIGEDIVETGYGHRWPNEPRGIKYYEGLANEVNLKVELRDRIGSTFHLQLLKVKDHAG